MSSAITVPVNGRIVNVTKLGLGAYAEVFGALEKLPSTLSSFLADNSKKDEKGNTSFDGQGFTSTLISKLPFLLKVALPEIAQILSVATKGQLTKDEVIEDVGLDEATALLQAILEINQISKVVDNVKKLMASQLKSNPAIGSTEQSTSSPQNMAGASEQSLRTSHPTTSLDTPPSLPSAENPNT